MQTNYNNILQLLPVPKYQDQKIMRNQSTNDIIRELTNSYYLYSDQGKNIFSQFYSDDPIRTAKNIHKFLKDNVEYEIEPENNQTSKSLSRYLNDGFGDCKHYSLAIASILKFMPKYDKICFRFVSYDMFNPSVTHVYVVAKTTNGDTITIDPLQDFNYEKKFYFHKDKCFKTHNMALSRLSGIRRTPNYMHFSKTGSHCGCGIGSHCNCNNAVGASLAKKILAAPARNAFLGLVRLGTFLNIGMKVKGLYENNPAKLKTWWVDKFGGSWTSLEKAINSLSVVSTTDREQSIEAYGGETRTDSRKEYCDAKYPWSLSPFSKRQKCYNHKIDGIGTAPAGAAFLVAAAPVLVALTGLIKEVGGGSSQAWDDKIPDPGNGGGGGDFNFTQYLPLVAIAGAAYLLLKK